MAKALHTRMKVFSRSNGHSAVAAAAYRSSKELYDQRLGQSWDYTRKSDVVYSAIIAPENAPRWVQQIIDNQDRETLWNRVEASEKRVDAQVAREFEGELSRHLDLETNTKIVKAFVQEHFTSRGMIADISIHNHTASDGGDNPHFHVMLTMREIEDNGFKRTKNREWNNYYSENKQAVIAGHLRTDLADRTNAEHEKAGVPIRIDPRSFKEQGIDVTPGIHLGKAAAQIEESGIASRRGNEQRDIEMKNIARALKQWSTSETSQQELDDLALTQLMRQRDEERLKQSAKVTESHSQGQGMRV